MIRTAIQFMRYDRPKSIGIIVGIVISIFLIGQQLGTLKFITVAMGGLIDNANLKAGEVWVISKGTENVNVLTKIDTRLVNEIRSIQGVQNTYPIVVANGNFMLPDGTSAPVTLVGSNGPVFAGGPDTTKIFKGDINSLNQANTVSAEYFNAKALGAPLNVGSSIEINGKNATIKVQTKNAQGFGGYFMFTNIDNARFYGRVSENDVSIISVKIKPGADARAVAKRINQTFYGVRAWLPDKLRQSTIKQLLVSTNMGVSFGTLVIFAIVSGFFIIGLTLYSSALDRLKDYGTLKAMGATNGYVRNLILLQALLFALIGFAIAMLLLLLFKQGVANAGLILNFSPLLILGLSVITLFISVGGSLFAVRKINKLEPASVFR